MRPTLPLPSPSGPPIKQPSTCTPSPVTMPCCKLPWTMQSFTRLVGPMSIPSPLSGRGDAANGAARAKVEDDPDLEVRDAAVLHDRQCAGSVAVVDPDACRA